jgi:hypothetical protein
VEENQGVSLEHLILPPAAGRFKALGLLDHGLGLLLGEGHELAPPDLEDVVDEAFEGLAVGQEQIALEDDAVKAGEHGDDHWVNLVTKRDSVFMASSSGVGPKPSPFGPEDAVIAHPSWLRLCHVRLARDS